MSLLHPPVILEACIQVGVLGELMIGQSHMHKGNFGYFSNLLDTVLFLVMFYILLSTLPT